MGRETEAVGRETEAVGREDGWVEADAVVERLAWGRNVYTILRRDELLTSAAL